MEFTTSRDGTLIAYDVRGDGPPLIYTVATQVTSRHGRSTGRLRTSRP